METTLTIDGLDVETFERLHAEAGRRGVAVSVLARILLKQSMESSGAIYHDLDELIGTWSKKEAAEFEANTSGTRTIDAELWLRSPSLSTPTRIRR